MQNLSIKSKLGDTISYILRSIYSDPFEGYEPPPPISFNFTKKKPKEEKPKTENVKPFVFHSAPSTDIKEKITLTGVKKQKFSLEEKGFSCEVVGEKDPLVTEAEMSAILEKFSAIDKNAVVICKRGWAKNWSNALIIAELKKFDLKYSETYVKFMKSIFNKSREADTV